MIRSPYLIVSEISSMTKPCAFAKKVSLVKIKKRLIQVNCLMENIKYEEMTILEYLNHETSVYFCISTSRLTINYIPKVIYTFF